ncbi:MAG: hypothetical protein PF569_08955 [Candidatus Woesearchaeota archaeon]|nr:hypothetical protein [Candidatus Woesearchaeota archaeon]
MRKNKKANIYEEEILAIISIIFIAFVLFMSSKFVIQTNEDINKMAPELSYQFPAVVTHAFLMKKIDKTHLEDLGLDINNKYFIKDLLKINSEESLKIVDEYKEKYLEKINTNTNSGKKPIEYYEEYSSDSLNIDNLLIYQTNLESISSNLESEIENKNYFFYFKTYDNKYVKIDFKS